MNLNEIDRKTPEGRLLWAALIVLTTSPGLRIAGEDVRGSATEPEEMLAKLEQLAQLEEKLSPDPQPTGSALPTCPVDHRDITNLTSGLLG